ncbi:MULTISPECIES: nucleotidyltransferase family protein [unclassified Rickettsia]|uniref:nucleotidyltransferase family protein n=1 Tax=unclassified Rickettsia TaxID=114295 RepID=UPI003132D84D
MEPKHFKIVQEILAKYPYNFYAYGSRVKGNPRRLSDLDLCFIENIPWSVRSHIDEDFEESDLPFIVEVIDYNKCGEDFRKLIKDDLQLVQNKNKEQ